MIDKIQTLQELEDVIAELLKLSQAIKDQYTTKVAGIRGISAEIPNISYEVMVAYGQKHKQEPKHLNGNTSMIHVSNLHHNVWDNITLMSEPVRVKTVIEKL